MLDALDITEEEAQGLAEIAGHDLALARDFARRALAAEDNDEACRLGRSYQRAARSYRQTLMAKARLARERDAGVRERDAASREQALAEARKRVRCNELADQLGEILHGFTEPHEREAAVDALEREIEAESERPDFLDADRKELIARICARLPLDDEPEAAPVEPVGQPSAEAVWPGASEPPIPADPDDETARRESG